MNRQFKAVVPVLAHKVLFMAYGMAFYLLCKPFVSDLIAALGQIEIKNN